MLSHIDESNNPSMVNVSKKVSTFRKAVARSVIQVPNSILSLLDGNEMMTKKGPVFSTAIIAGTMAVKKTSDLIPLCHPLPIEGCRFDISINAEKEIVVLCEVDTHHKTGIEMEALTGASIAALTIYDMCKALSHDIKICRTELLEKEGGKSDYKK